MSISAGWLEVSTVSVRSVRKYYPEEYALMYPEKGEKTSDQR